MLNNLTPIVEESGFNKKGETNLQLKAGIAEVSENIRNGFYRKAGNFDVLGDKLTCLCHMVPE